MRVFVAAGTGVLGRRLVSQLVAKAQLDAIVHQMTGEADQARGGLAP